MPRVVQMKSPMIGVDGAGLPPLIIVFAYREDDREEHHPRVVVPHTDMNLCIGVIERNGNPELDAAFIERVFEAGRLRFVQASRLWVSACFPLALCHESEP